MRWPEGSLAVVVALATWCWSPAPARACSCDPSARVLPVGADAPLNALVTVTSSFGIPSELGVFDEAGLAVAGTSANLPLHARSSGVQSFRPAQPLSPRTRYEVRVGDLPIGSFTTGDSIDETPPAAPVIDAPRAQAFLPHQASCGNSCVSGSSELVTPLRVDVADTRIFVELRSPDEAEPFATLAWEFDAARPTAVPEFGLGGCASRAPELVPYATICVTAVVWDVAGNQARSAEECLVVQGCSARSDLDTDCAPEPIECSATPPVGDQVGGCAVAPGGAGGDLAGLAVALLLALRARLGTVLPN